MKVRNIDLIFLSLLVLAGVTYLIFALRFFRDDSLDFYLNPGFFPVILASLLLLLSVVTLVRTTAKRHNTDKFPLENIKKIAIVCVLTAAYIIIWHFFSGIYYVLTVIYFMSFSLLLSWNKSENRKKLITLTSVVAIGLTLGIYLLFDLTFSIRMT